MSKKHKKPNPYPQKIRRNEPVQRESDVANRVSARENYLEFIAYGLNPEYSSRNYITARRDAMKNVVVVKRADVCPTIYRSRWVPANHGLQAEFKIGGRPVFPADGPQPANDGRVYAFELVGDNKKRNVWYARIRLPEAEPIIKKNESGKYCCENRQVPQTFFHKAPKQKRPEWDEYARDEWDDELPEYLAGAYGDYFGAPEEDDSDFEESLFWDEVDAISQMLLLPTSAARSDRLSWARVCMPRGRIRPTIDWN